MLMSCFCYDSYIFLGKKQNKKTTQNKLETCLLNTNEDKNTMQDSNSEKWKIIVKRSIINGVSAGGAVPPLPCRGQHRPDSVDMSWWRQRGELAMAVDLTPRFRRLKSQTASFRETIQHGNRYSRNHANKYTCNLKRSRERVLRLVKHWLRCSYKFLFFFYFIQISGFFFVLVKPMIIK